MAPGSGLCRSRASGGAVVPRFAEPETSDTTCGSVRAAGKVAPERRGGTLCRRGRAEGWPGMASAVAERALLTGCPPPLCRPVAFRRSASAACAQYGSPDRWSSRCRHAIRARWADGRWAASRTFRLWFGPLWWGWLTEDPDRLVQRQRRLELRAEGDPRCGGWLSGAGTQGTVALPRRSGGRPTCRRRRCCALLKFSPRALSLARP